MVRWDEDSGLDTLWLLKKMAFRSEERSKREEKRKKALAGVTPKDQQVVAKPRWPG